MHYGPMQNKTLILAKVVTNLATLQDSPIGRFPIADLRLVAHNAALELDREGADYIQRAKAEARLRAVSKFTDDALVLINDVSEPDNHRLVVARVVAAVAHRLCTALNTVNAPGCLSEIVEFEAARVYAGIVAMFQHASFSR